MHRWVSSLVAFYISVGLVRSPISASYGNDNQIFAFSVCDRNIMYNYSKEAKVFVGKFMGMFGNQNFAQVARMVDENQKKQTETLKLVKSLIETSNLNAVPLYFLRLKLVHILRGIYNLVETAGVVVPAKKFKEEEAKFQQNLTDRFRQQISTISRLAMEAELTVEYVTVTFNQIRLKREAPEMAPVVELLEAHIREILDDVYRTLVADPKTSKLNAKSTGLLLEFFNTYVNWTNKAVILSALFGSDMKFLNPSSKGMFLTGDFFHVEPRDDLIYPYMIIDKALLVPGDNSLDLAIIKKVKAKPPFVLLKLLSAIDDPDSNIAGKMNLEVGSVKRIMRNFYYVVVYLITLNVLNVRNLRFAPHIIRQWLLATTCYDFVSKNINYRPSREAPVTTPEKMALIASVDMPDDVRPVAASGNQLPSAMLSKMSEMLGPMQGGQPAVKTTQSQTANNQKAGEPPVNQTPVVQKPIKTDMEAMMSRVAKFHEEQRKKSQMAAMEKKDTQPMATDQKVGQTTERGKRKYRLLPGNEDGSTQTSVVVDYDENEKLGDFSKITNSLILNIYPDHVPEDPDEPAAYVRPKPNVDVYRVPEDPNFTRFEFNNAEKAVEKLVKDSLMAEIASPASEPPPDPKITSKRCGINNYVDNLGKFIVPIWKITEILDEYQATVKDIYILKNKPIYSMDFNKRYLKTYPRIGNEILKMLSKNPLYKVIRTIMKVVGLESENAPITTTRLSEAKDRVQNVFFEVVRNNILAKSTDVAKKQIEHLLNVIEESEPHVETVLWQLSVERAAANDVSPTIEFLPLLNDRLITIILGEVAKLRTPGFVMYMKHTLNRPYVSPPIPYFTDPVATEARFFDFYFFFMPKIDRIEVESTKLEISRLEPDGPVFCAGGLCKLANMSLSTYLQSRRVGLKFMESVIFIFEMYYHNNKPHTRFYHERGLLDLFNSIYSFIANIRHTLYVPFDSAAGILWDNLRFCVDSLGVEKDDAAVKSRCRLSIRKYTEMFYFVFFFIVKDTPGLMLSYESYVNSRVEYRLDPFLRYMSLPDTDLSAQVEAFCEKYKSMRICMAFRMFINTLNYIEFDTVQFDAYYERYLAPEMEEIERRGEQVNKYRAVIWNVLIAISKMERQHKQEFFFRLLDQGRIDYEFSRLSKSQSKKIAFQSFFDLVEFVDSRKRSSVEKKDIEFFADFLYGRYATRPTAAVENHYKVAIEKLWTEDASLFKYENRFLLSEIFEFFSKYTSKKEHYEIMARLLITEHRTLDIVRWSASRINEFEAVVIKVFAEKYKVNDEPTKLVREAIVQYKQKLTDLINQSREADAKGVPFEVEVKLPDDAGKKAEQEKKASLSPFYQALMKQMMAQSVILYTPLKMEAPKDEFLTGPNQQKFVVGNPATSYEIEQAKKSAVEEPRAVITTNYIRRIRLKVEHADADNAADFLSEAVSRTQLEQISSGAGSKVTMPFLASAAHVRI